MYGSADSGQGAALITPADLPDRLAEKIEVEPDGCWIWTASLRVGYGQVRDGLRVRGAHVVVFELLVGPIAPRLQLDHLCRVRRCVNPAHLEQVTQAENIRRGDAPAARLARRTECLRGHPFIGRRATGRRSCGICSRAVAPL